MKGLGHFGRGEKVWSFAFTSCLVLNRIPLKHLRSESNPHFLFRTAMGSHVKLWWRGIPLSSAAEDLAS